MTILSTAHRHILSYSISLAKKNLNVSIFIHKLRTMKNYIAGLV